MKYRVLVDDNFHFMDEGSRYCAGEYDTAEEALARAKDIVESSLQEVFKPGISAKQLYDQYVAFGGDPYIVGPEEVSFSAWDYARDRAAQLCS